MDFLFGRSAPDLDDWERRPFAPGTADGPTAGDRRDAWERVVASEAPGEPVPDGPHRRAASALLAYRIFPPDLVEGVLRRAPVEVGDTVGIRYHFAPGIDLFFAARVIDRFDAQRGAHWCTGFTYRTLTGHPELGEETFAVEKELATGDVRIALRSWSRPGTLLARAMAPWVRHLQVQGSQRAIGHLAERVRLPAR